MNSSPKILMQLTACPYGGVETHVYYLSLLLAEAGAEVTLTSQRKFELNEEWTANLRRAGVKIVAPPAWAKKFRGPAGLIASRLYLARQIPAKSFDIALGHGHGGAFAWLRRFVKPGGMCLWDEHWYGVPTRADHYGSQLYAVPLGRLSFRMRRMISKMDAIIAGSERARRNLMEIQQVKTPIRVIRPLDKPEDVPKAVDRQYTDSSPLRLGLIARLGYGKGVGALLHIWKDIQIGNAELHFYGVDPGNRLQALGQQLGLAGVFFHGPFEQSTYARILTDLDIGLMLSFEEGYSAVAWEYMLYGVPFVMTDVGAAPEFTGDNPDALMVACDNHAVKEGIREMARRVRSGSTSRERLQAFQQKNFSFEEAAALHLKAMLEPKQFWENASQEERPQGWPL